MYYIYVWMYGCMNVCMCTTSTRSICLYYMCDPADPKCPETVGMISGILDDIIWIQVTAVVYDLGARNDADLGIRALKGAGNDHRISKISHSQKHLENFKFWYLGSSHERTHQQPSKKERKQGATKHAPSQTAGDLKRRWRPPEERVLSPTIAMIHLPG